MKIENQKVSIIVPVYNGVQFLEETVTSVRKQTWQDWELLLVDDCSEDGSYELMKRLASEDPRAIPLRQEQNSGAAQARNRGVMEASGKYIAFLDADDLWLPDKLSHEMEFMKRTGAGFVFSGYEFADEKGKGLGKVVRVPETINYRQALQNTTIFTSTVLFDTHRIPKELIRMPLVKSEDTALWWSLLRRGYTAYGLNENLVLYRRSAGTLSANKLEAVKRIWYLYRKVENLGILYSAYNFVFYALRAVLRRV